jgi:hypothetical protein
VHSSFKYDKIVEQLLLQLEEWPDARVQLENMVQIYTGKCLGMKIFAKKQLWFARCHSQ